MGWPANAHISRLLDRISAIGEAGEVSVVGWLAAMRSVGPPKSSSQLAQHQPQLLAPVCLGAVVDLMQSAAIQYRPGWAGGRSRVVSHGDGVHDGDLR